MKPRIAIKEDAQALMAAPQEGPFWRYKDGWRCGSWFTSSHSMRRLIKSGFMQVWQATNTQIESATVTPLGYSALRDFMTRKEEGRPCSATQAA